MRPTWKTWYGRGSQQSKSPSQLRMCYRSWASGKVTSFLRSSDSSSGRGVLTGAGSISMLRCWGEAGAVLSDYPAKCNGTLLPTTGAGREDSLGSRRTDGSTRPRSPLPKRDARSGAIAQTPDLHVSRATHLPPCGIVPTFPQCVTHVPGLPVTYLPGLYRLCPCPRTRGKV